MTHTNISWNDLNQLLKELVEFHQNQLLKCGRRIIPHLTPEDLLQPNDFQELEYNPHFRYEEGVVAGVQIVQTALQALINERQSSINIE